MARIIRAMTRDGSVRAAVMDSRDIVERANEIHRCRPTASAALGRTLTAASLMGCLMPEKDDLVTLSFRGDGEGGTVLASADYYGNVRGYIANPACDPPRKPNGKLDVSACVGRGLMSVMREEGGKEPYVGTAEIVSGEIAEDIASYYARSEQIPTVCALGVLVTPDGLCLSAGGALIQLLPFADEETVAILERNTAEAKPITSILAEGTPEQVLEMFFRDIPYDVFDSTECSYKCVCSRAKTDRALISLGRSELESIIADPQPTVLTCQFCDKTYEYSKDDIRKLLKESNLK